MRQKSLKSIRFEQATLAVSYENYFINNVTFVNCDLSNNEFVAATLNRVTFEGCNLQLTDFKKASLEHVNFINCNLNKIQLEEASLEWVRFKQIRTLQNSNYGNMENANLLNAKTVNCRFRSINLAYSTLDFSSHAGTKFIRGTLQYAYLQGTDWLNCEWRDVTLYHTNLFNIHWLGHTFVNIDFRASEMHEIVLADNKQPGIKKYLFKTKPTVITNTFFRDAQTRHIKVKANDLRLAFQPNHLTIWYVYFPLMNLLCKQKTPVLNIMFMLQSLAMESIPNNLGKSLPDVVFNHDYSALINTDATRPKLPDCDSTEHLVASTTKDTIWTQAGRHEKLLLIQEMFSTIKPILYGSSFPTQLEKNCRKQINRLKDLYVSLAIKFKDCAFVRYQVAKDANDKRSIINFNTGFGISETSIFKRLLPHFKDDIAEYAQDIHPLLRRR